MDIIDCEKQVTYKMTLEEYIEYFESFERNKIYNVLSLEISDTKYVDKPQTAPGSPCLTRSDCIQVRCLDDTCSALEGETLCTYLHWC